MFSSGRIFDLITPDQSDSAHKKPKGPRQSAQQENVGQTVFSLLTPALGKSVTHPVSVTLHLVRIAPQPSVRASVHAFILQLPIPFTHLPRALRYQMGFLFLCIGLTYHSM